MLFFAVSMGSSVVCGVHAYTYWLVILLYIDTLHYGRGVLYCIVGNTG